MHQPPTFVELHDGGSDGKVGQDDWISWRVASVMSEWTLATFSSSSICTSGFQPWGRHTPEVS